MMRKKKTFIFLSLSVLLLGVLNWGLRSAHAKRYVLQMLMSFAGIQAHWEVQEKSLDKLVLTNISFKNEEKQLEIPKIELTFKPFTHWNRIEIVQITCPSINQLLFKPATKMDGWRLGYLRFKNHLLLTCASRFMAHCENLEIYKIDLKNAEGLAVSIERFELKGLEWNTHKDLLKFQRLTIERVQLENQNKTFPILHPKLYLTHWKQNLLAAIFSVTEQGEWGALGATFVEADQIKVNQIQYIGLTGGNNLLFNAMEAQLKGCFSQLNVRLSAEMFGQAFIELNGQCGFYKKQWAICSVKGQLKNSKSLNFSATFAGDLSEGIGLKLQLPFALCIGKICFKTLDTFQFTLQPMGAQSSIVEHIRPFTLRAQGKWTRGWARASGIFNRSSSMPCKARLGAQWKNRRGFLSAYIARGQGKLLSAFQIHSGVWSATLFANQLNLLDGPLELRIEKGLLHCNGTPAHWNLKVIQHFCYSLYGQPGGFHAETGTNKKLNLPSERLRASLGNHQLFWHVKQVLNGEQNEILLKSDSDSVSSIPLAGWIRWTDLQAAQWSVTAKVPRFSWLSFTLKDLLVETKSAMVSQPMGHVRMHLKQLDLGEVSLSNVGFGASVGLAQTNSSSKQLYCIVSQASFGNWSDQALCLNKPVKFCYQLGTHRWRLYPWNLQLGEGQLSGDFSEGTGIKQGFMQMRGNQLSFSGVEGFNLQGKFNVQLGGRWGGNTQNPEFNCDLQSSKLQLIYALNDGNRLRIPVKRMEGKFHTDLNTVTFRLHLCQWLNEEHSKKHFVTYIDWRNSELHLQLQSDQYVLQLHTMDAVVPIRLNGCWTVSGNLGQQQCLGSGYVELAAFDTPELLYPETRLNLLGLGEQIRAYLQLNALHYLRFKPQIDCSWKKNFLEVENLKSSLKIPKGTVPLEIPLTLSGINGKGHLNIDRDLEVAWNGQRLQGCGKVSLQYLSIKLPQFKKGETFISEDETIVTARYEEGSSLFTLSKRSELKSLLGEWDLHLSVGPACTIEAFGASGNLVGQLSLFNQKQRLNLYGKLKVENTYPNHSNPASITQYGQKFYLQKGEMKFTGSLNPYVFLEAVRDPSRTQDNVLAGIRFEGEFPSQVQGRFFTEPMSAGRTQAQAAAYLLYGLPIEDPMRRTHAGLSDMLLASLSTTVLAWFQMLLPPQFLEKVEMQPCYLDYQSGEEKYLAISFRFRELNHLGLTFGVSRSLAC